jgi:hypothetical protein
VRDPATPVILALRHAGALGPDAPAEAAAGLTERAVRDGGLDAAQALVDGCRRAGWTGQRAAIQKLWLERLEAWRVEDETGLRYAVRSLLAWDEAARDPERTALALDICDRVRQDRDPFVEAWLARVRDGAHPALAERAARLLKQ